LLIVRVPAVEAVFRTRTFCVCDPVMLLLSIRLLAPNRLVMNAPNSLAPFPAPVTELPLWSLKLVTVVPRMAVLPVVVTSRLLRVMPLTLVRSSALSVALSTRISDSVTF
jgi:hypothetical protein